MPLVLLVGDALSLPLFSKKKLNNYSPLEKDRDTHTIPPMSSKRYSHCPLPTIRLNAKGRIICPVSAMRPVSAIRPVSPMRPYQSGHTLDLAVKAPLAPITNLSYQQRIREEQPLLIPNMTYADIQALSIAVDVAEFVLA